ncbi:glycerophosphodiester phosphodiesterase [Streptomyces cinnamoneus]|uniref:glycerophosphodiester phosphodiesterase n=1 Tax=Streptomyces cinnamoneus TaxID=53446 RepID=A0A2G1XQ05_STRCJ|nr:glycerophosphodiester phosphodiesterase [Streptomyces cinnamoneus]PHQ53312.1 glycerophosphodiester phosphodiesterase [Streptomyces cinnamoneus]PPT12409.1 glycerophosphodiester phosphodiesterase [Streptomyces cinnamoneus]
MQQEQRPGRRTVLGAAAALGAGAVALGGGASPASAAPRGAEAHGDGGSYKNLPVPTVIGHRGACGYRPEHTFGSYEYALANGADVIEQDLVPTKDGHLVCRHENDITATTDVASRPEFASRKTTKTVDGEAHTGWFTEDFTLAELKTLRAKERIPGNRQHNTPYDGRWQVPTFEEVLKWADEQGRKRGRRIWLHVETKHPTYFRKAGLGLEERLAKLLRRYGRSGRNGYTFIQSFEPGSLQRLNKLGVDCPKVLLLDDLPTRPWDFVEAGDPRTVADLITPKGLAWVSGFAQGIGPWLNLIIPRDKDEKLTKPTTLVRDAHAAGLILHPYTMRNENSFLPADFRRGSDPNGYGDAFAAFKTYFATGIDGIFSDNCDTAALARADFVKR